MNKEKYWNPNYSKKKVRKPGNKNKNSGGKPGEPSLRKMHGS